MKTFNGKRLKSARQYRGLTVEELSQRINVSKQSISQYENGIIENVPFDKVLALSIELKFPYNYFIQKDSGLVRSGSTYFRSLMKTSKKYRTAQIVKMEHLAEIYVFLNEYLDFPQLNLPNWIGNIESPGEAACALRDYWGLSDGPIDNIIRTVEQNGILVTTFATDTDDIDAFSQFVEFGNESIYLIAISNNKDSAARINFDVAHELGHIILHEWSEDEEAISREEFKNKEKEANEFAAAFLMPEKEFAKEVSLDSQNLDYYIQLKRKWRVSIVAMLYRACSLEIITPNQYQYMMRIMQNKGWRKSEPLDSIIRTPKPSLLSDAIDVLLVNKVFTPQELVEELGNMGLAMEPSELEILLNLKPGTLIQKVIPNERIVALKSNISKNGEQ